MAGAYRRRQRNAAVFARLVDALPAEPRVA